jgi:Domain of Unknown Function (DUF1206)
MQVSMAGQSTAQRAGQAAEEAASSRPVQLLGRVGLVAYGVVHLLIAYLAIQVAFGEGGEPGKSGALQTLAEQPAGRALLWVVAAGLAALALWQLAEAAFGYRYVQPSRRAALRRLTSAGEALVYAVLAVTAAKVAGRGHGQSSEEQKEYSAQLLELPAGQVIVGAAGIGVVAIAVYLVRRGLGKSFADDLDLSRADPTARRTAIRLGQVGWTALGIAYGIVGVLVVVAAATYDAERATGLDTALLTLARQPYGTVLLCVLAAGLACFGIYCLFDARYRRG